MNSDLSEAFHYLSKTASAAAAAWDSATVTNEPHVRQVLDALATLAAAADASRPPPAPAALSQMHDAASDSLCRLETALRRLRAIATGVDRWLPEVHADTLVHATAVGFVQSLRVDIDNKTAVVRSLLTAVDGGVPISADRASVLLAFWVEQTARVAVPDNGADVLVALIEARALLRDVGGDDELMGSPRKMRGNQIPGLSNEALSPALAMLKRNAAR